MSDTERRLRIAMLDQKISRQQLAQDLGIKVTTLGNIIRGGRCSPALKKKIHAVLGICIWSDTPGEIHLNKDVEFIFPAVKLATEFIEEIEREFGAGTVFRRTPRCRTVGFLRDLLMMVAESASSSTRETAARSEKNRKISASSNE